MTNQTILPARAREIAAQLIPHLTSAHNVALIGQALCAERLIAKAEDPKTRPRQCGFCGKGEDDVFCLVAGPIANICEDCIECAALVVSKKREIAHV